MRPIRGITYKLISVAMFITMSSLVKSVSDTIPPGEAVFFRSFFAMPVILVWLAFRRELKTGLRVSKPLGHFWRGLVGTTSMGMGFAALAFLPLPEVTAIGYAAPLLVVIFASMFLGEDVRVFRLSAVFAGLAGVMIVLSPRLSVGADVTTGEAFGAMLALTGAVCAALAQVTVRKLVATEQTAAIVFWFSFTAAGLGLLTLPFGWAMPSPTEAVTLVLMGLIGGVGQIFLTSSYREADASLVAPFDYASMLLALAIGYWVFGEVPTGTMLIGASIVVSAGIFIIWRERQLGLERAKQRKAMSPQG
ncbi:DMT family transporter [Pararhodobacter sp. CCB-MM2]|uniref:DMT family transporter n=1 Tax=Pararhodobacter sp. CCB-MM2 TaxID=1786003 RepID=UPI000832D613|nr:DMT family transporter [Pararhodobacter sp. CCB-MM2]MCA2011546.1 DMT family transporter [Cereibacter sphaeroides]